eukprot:scaffold65271_cov19-Tisochrysis_lutea.AAC.1
MLYQRTGSHAYLSELVSALTVGSFLNARWLLSSGILRILHVSAKQKPYASNGVRRGQNG